MLCQGSQEHGGTAPAAPPSRDLDPLFAPASVAVLGASDDPAKWGHLLSRRLLEAAPDATVHLVNRRGAPVLGRPTVRTLAEARAANDGPLDLVAVCVPAAGYEQAVDEALAAGARAVVAVTAGLAEQGADGVRTEHAVRDRVRAAGAVLVGPNCLGVADTGSRLQLSSERLEPGPVAVLSQSGNLVIDLAGLLDERGLGFSRFVSLGNQSDLGVVDFLRACVGHEQTRAVAVYAEDVRDGRGFVRAARALADAGTPVVLLAPGRSAAATRGAVSHTGSLTTRSDVVDVACRAGRVHRVDSPGEMADVLSGLVGPRRAAGRRVAVLTDGGGHGAVAADCLESAGLSVPVLGPELGTRLSEALWPGSTVTNPVDLAGAGERDPGCFTRAVGALLGSPEVDAVLMTGYFGGYATTGVTGQVAGEHAAARAIAGLVISQPKPLVVQSIHPGSPSMRVLRDAGVPVFRDVPGAARTLAALVADDPVADVLTVPPPAPPVVDTGYAAARALFADAGVPFTRARQVHDEAGLREAVRALGAPLVLKATGLLHKSDAGGVVLDLTDEAAAVAAYHDLRRRLAPPSVSVEQMARADDGVEVLVGTVTDARFGPVLMVGLGGVLTEVLADVALDLAPVDVPGARRLLQSLRGAPLLTGVRGRPPVDLDALAAVVATVSQVAAAHPELAETELNPVLATPDGALALDARVVPRSL